MGLPGVAQRPDASGRSRRTATPEDTFAGYGRLKEEEAPDPERPFRTPAVAEMAQERALRHAAQNAFAWDCTSALVEPASRDHRRVDPENGQVSPTLEDGSPLAPRKVGPSINLQTRMGCGRSLRETKEGYHRQLMLPDSSHKAALL